MITVPAVLITLFLFACMAFVFARFSFKLKPMLLGVFVAAAGSVIIAGLTLGSTKG